MTIMRNRKTALLTAASLLAATAALAPAKAADFDPVAYPTTVQETVVSHAADHADESKQSPAKRWGLIAVAAGALAGLVKLIGARKIAKGVGDAATQAVKMSGKAAGAAAKTVGRAVASPLRFAVLMAGLALFALAGVGFYDVEWLGGLIVGGAMTCLFVYGAVKARKVLTPKPLKIPAKRH